MRLALILFSSFLLFSCTKNQPIQQNTNIKVSSNTVAIDLRSLGELEANPAPGAIHIPISQIESALNLPKDKNTPILVFCESGGRASVAKGALEKRGYNNVKNITDWRTWNKLQANN